MNRTQGWVGLPMKSKCLNYNVPSSTCVPLNILEKQQWGPIDYVEGEPYDYKPESSESKSTEYRLWVKPFQTNYNDSFGVLRPLQSYRTIPAQSNVLSADFYGQSRAPPPVLDISWQDPYPPTHPPTHPLPPNRTPSALRPPVPSPPLSAALAAAASGKFCGEVSPGSATAPAFAPAFVPFLGSFDPFRSGAASPSAPPASPSPRLSPPTTNISPPRTATTPPSTAPRRSR